jgi:hypothetical protein
MEMSMDVVAFSSSAVCVSMAWSGEKYGIAVTPAMEK